MKYCPYSKPIYFILAIFILFFGVAVIFVHSTAHKKNRYPVPIVETIIVGQQVVHDTIEAMGIVKAVQSIQVSAEMPGIIKNIYVQSGQNVMQGQLLLDLRAGEVQANFDKLQAKLAHDIQNNKRSKRLLAEQVISIADAETTTATMKEDQAEVAQAQALLEKYQVRAPFAGLLGLISVNSGQYLTSGQTITTLEQLSTVYIDLPIPERLLGQIQLTHAISIRSSAYPGQVFSAYLSASSHAVDVNNGSSMIRLTVDNPDKKLLSGMSVTVTITQQAKNVLVVPESALTYEPEGAMAYIVDKKNTVHRQLLNVLPPADGFAVVVSGVQSGDKLVIAGQQALQNGMFVRTTHANTY